MIHGTSKLQRWMFSRLRLVILLTLVVFIVIIFNYSSKLSRKRHLAAVWPSHQSRNVSTYIRPEASTLILQPRGLHSTPPKTVVIFVTSSLKNFKAREGIRNTWSQGSDKAKVVFVLGKSKSNKSEDIDILSESLKYGDVLQEDFVDSYTNLTIKSLMMFKYYKNRCSEIPYMLKTDDDVFINVNNLLTLVNKNTQKDLLTGTLICNATPKRDPHDKYYSPKYMFDGKIYPRYLSGTGYLISRSAALKIYEESLHTPAFHMEDVYITGIVASKVGVKRRDNLKFSYLKKDPKKICLFNASISAHEVSPDEMFYLHRRLSERKFKCDSFKDKDLRPPGFPNCDSKNQKKKRKKS